jgi:hypothetical protein
MFKEGADDLEMDEGEGLLGEDEGEGLLDEDPITPDVEIQMKKLGGGAGPTLERLSEAQSSEEARAVLKVLSRFEVDNMSSVSASAFWRAAKQAKETVLEAGETWPEEEYKVGVGRTLYLSNRCFSRFLSLLLLERPFFSSLQRAPMVKPSRR